MEHVIEEDANPFAALADMSSQPKNPRINFLISKSQINEVFLYS